MLDRVGEVDPEDVQMHYTAMLCYRGLGDTESAAREETAVPAVQGRRVVAGDHRRRRRLSPEDNNERQPIHEHESVPLAARRPR